MMISNFEHDGPAYRNKENKKTQQIEISTSPPRMYTVSD